MQQPVHTTVRPISAPTPSAESTAPGAPRAPRAPANNPFSYGSPVVEPRGSPVAPGAPDRFRSHPISFDEVDDDLLDANQLVQEIPKACRHLHFEGM